MIDTLINLLRPRPASQILDEIKADLEKVKNFPVTNWNPGAPYLFFLQLMSKLLEVSDLLAVLIAKSGFLDLAEGEWLTLLARSFYELERQPAGFAKGQVLFTVAPGAGPYPITAGSHYVSAPTGQRYVTTNPAPVQISSAAPVSIPVQALVPGDAANIGLNTPLALDAPGLLGVTVTNPVVANGTWLTEAGTPEEPDGRLRERCHGRWPQLANARGLPPVAETLISLALTVRPDVTKCRVYSNLRNGQAAAQWVTVYLAGPAGAVQPPAVAAVLAALLPRMGLNDKLDVRSAVAVQVPVVATVNFLAEFNTAANRAQILANLAALQAVVPIGGRVYRTNLIKVLEGGADPLIATQKAVHGVRDVVLNLPAADLVLNFDSVAALVPTITFTGV